MKHFKIDGDDLPIGRVLSRREVVQLLGMGSAFTLLGGCVPPSAGGGRPGGPGGGASAEEVTTINESLPSGCVVRPELTEGPVFVEEDLNRVDIRTDPLNGTVSEGVQLDLTFNISQVNEGACVPLSGVQVDIWHCDAFGIYSDTSELGMDTVGQKFLRGYQITDENGVAKFITIYPGWYEGRAVHIHFKIRSQDGYDFTSQLFFDEALTDSVFTLAPYNTRGERSLRNENDGIYQEGGSQLMLNPQQVETGYAATFDVALQLS